MTRAATDWASRVRGLNPAWKLVLWALADTPGDPDKAYPSLAAIVDFTGLNRKTIIAALDGLQGAGLIKDTGERTGRTGQIKVYRLALETVPEAEPLDETVPETGLSETVPKTEQYRKRNSSVFSGKESQKRYTEPIKGTTLQKATLSSGAREPRGARLDPDFEIPDEWIIWAIEQRGWSLSDAHDEGARFRDYWIAKAGKDGRKSDWPATWRNWVRNSRRQPAGQGGKSGRAFQKLQALRMENGQ